MPSFSKAILAGHLSRDPETRFTPKGTPIARFALGINRQWKDANGEKQEEVSFIDCHAFGKQAETLAKHVRKGSPLLVEGTLRQETWEDKETGERRSRVVVMVDGFQFLGGKKQEEPQEVGA